jgi:hypothetical protein
VSPTNEISIIILSLYHLHIPLLLNRSNCLSTLNHLNLILYVCGKLLGTLETSGPPRELLGGDLFEILIPQLLDRLLIVVDDKVVDLLGV